MEESKKQQPQLQGQQPPKGSQEVLEKNEEREGEEKKQEVSSGLRKELLAMQFQPTLVDKALQCTSDLESAIQYIITLLEEQDVQEISQIDNVKMVLLARMDLKMSLGKIAAQCAHATLRAYQLARTRALNDPQYSLTFIQWLQTGQDKITYQVDNEQQLFQTLQRFQNMGVGTCYIRDAGRTQIAAGSVTVGGVGPWGAKKLEALTRGLKRF